MPHPRLGKNNSFFPQCHSQSLTALGRTSRLSIASVRTVRRRLFVVRRPVAAKSLRLHGKVSEADGADEADAKVRLSGGGVRTREPPPPSFSLNVQRE
jgi:hypothetical protein